VAFGQDGSFSFDALVQRFNSDLANDYGNLASRTLSMIQRYFRGEVPYASAVTSRTAADKAIAEQAGRIIQECNTLFEDYQFSRALECVWSLVAAVNKYIVENEPWAVAEKDDEQSRSRLATTLYVAAEALRVATALVHPVIPQSSARIWQQLGLGDIGKFRLDQLKWGQLEVGTKLGGVEPVFPRTDKSAVARMQALEQRPAAVGTETKKPPATASPPPKAVELAAGQKTEGAPAGAGAQAGQRATEAVPPVAPSSAPPAKAMAAPPEGKIAIDDFAKIEMRVGQVKVAEKVKGADKLLRLEVDIGTEVRQLVAGIAEAYAPETLIGRKVVIVANLAPRKLRGLESNGMIVAASVEGGKPVLAGFLEDVPIGAKLK
jgi:methionyl-tRNA synthetase